MKEARTAAQVSILDSPPEFNLCGSAKINESNNTAANADNQPSSSRMRLPGNGCFHNPKKFRIAKKKEESKRRYHCIEEAKRRLQQTEHEKYKYLNFLGMLFKDSGRQKKSEARERDMNLFGQIILDTLNLTVMKCGMLTNKNVFVPWSLKKICGKYQDNEKRDLNYQRMDRALQEYKRAGYISVNDIRQLNDKGEWHTIDVEISVSEKLFRDLNLYEEYLSDRSKVLEKALKRQQSMNDKLQKLERFKHYAPPKKGFFKEISNKLNPSSTPTNRAQTQVGKEAQNKRVEQRKVPAPTIAQNPHVLALAKQIKEQQPNISYKEAIEIASQKIQLYDS